MPFRTRFSPALHISVNLCRLSRQYETLPALRIISPALQIVCMHFLAVTPRQHALLDGLSRCSVPLTPALHIQICTSRRHSIWILCALHAVSMLTWRRTISDVILAGLSDCSVHYQYEMLACAFQSSGTLCRHFETSA